MNKFVVSLVTAAIATLAGAAQAQQAYVGVGVATSDTTVFHDSTGEGHQSAGKIFAGYDFTSTWGVEAGYTKLGKTQGHSSWSPSTTVTTEGSRTYLAGKATLPLSQKVSVYGKLGATYNKAEAVLDGAIGDPTVWSENKTQAYGAVGAQYSVTPKVAVIAEYERYGKRKLIGHKADTVTVGARYSF